MYARMDLIYDWFLHAENKQTEQSAYEGPIQSGGRPRVVSIYGQ
ncbi:hypothetical protein P4H71_01750 [Paenibacillus kribbensis]|nr:hypothetical protein [Paenibacillus kribbensis]MEC0233080.1 hypothetical protein [Paenibacillus kribbensis]